jgi:RNA 3'-terminal phosphate cyclase
MVEIAPHRIDHALLRQILSVSLAAGEPVLVRGGTSFVNSTPAVQPLISDWERFIDAHKLGAFDIAGHDLSFTPGAVRHGSFRFQTNPYSSAVELVLLLAPALFLCPYRSALAIEGVTHASHSFATDFVRETLFSFLESMGFYASLSLKRFGFYGTGRGEIESRIFPAQMRPSGCLLPGGTPRVTGARVFFSRYRSSLAHRQKDILAQSLGLGGDAVGIVEIMNAAGSGNAMHAVLDWGGTQVILAHVADAFAFDGTHAADEESLCDAARAFGAYVHGCSGSGMFPAAAVRELVPYALMSGSRLPASDDPETVRESAAVVSAILGRGRVTPG